MNNLQNETNTKILSNYGGLDINHLTNILNCDLESQTETPVILKRSNYYDAAEILNESFSKISLNLKF